jgi:hypothetical protein
VVWSSDTSSSAESRASAGDLLARRGRRRTPVSTHARARRATASSFALSEPDRFQLTPAHGGRRSRSRAVAARSPHRRVCSAAQRSSVLPHESLGQGRASIAMGGPGKLSTRAFWVSGSLRDRAAAPETLETSYGIPAANEKHPPGASISALVSTSCSPEPFWTPRVAARLPLEALLGRNTSTTISRRTYWGSSRFGRTAQIANSVASEAESTRCEMSSSTSPSGAPIGGVGSSTRQEFPSTTRTCWLPLHSSPTHVLTSSESPSWSNSPRHCERTHEAVSELSPCAASSSAASSCAAAQPATIATKARSTPATLNRSL